MKCYLAADGLLVLFVSAAGPLDSQHVTTVSRVSAERSRKREKKNPVSGGQVEEIALLIAGVRGQSGQASNNRWLPPEHTSNVQTLRVRVVHQDVPNKVAGECVWLCE